MKWFKLSPEVWGLLKEVCAAALMAIANVLVQALLKIITGRPSGPMDPFEDPFM